jgi:6-phosphofructokinase 1
MTSEDLKIQSLGPCCVSSPLRLQPGAFISDEDKLRFDMDVSPGKPGSDDLLLERTGPRRMIHFDPTSTRAAIVTCGGLCPGINNVVRSLFLQLYHHYGVREVLGVRYGYNGFRPDAIAPPVWLTPEYVSQIHQRGGTVLGSSRGPVPPGMVVDFLERERISILFGIGGDGTQRGMHGIYEEVTRRGARIAVVGIPKTIDNDIAYVWRTFGFASAVDRAHEIIDCAHVEAKDAPNGISVVKLMGRDAGFIAAAATIACQDVNFCLIPEVPFKLEGETGLLALLERRMAERHHAVIAVAEGAGQDLFPSAPEERDASGNVRHKDIGLFLREAIQRHFTARGITINLRYFDPSYYIRSVAAASVDALLCDQLARHAVHAGMAGKTDLLIGDWHGVLVHVPIPLSTSERKRIRPDSDIWKAVLAATGQPEALR